MNTNQPEYKPVYILGAGTSNMVGGPLLKDFMKSARHLRYASHFKDQGLIDMFDKVFEYQRELFETKAFIGSNLDNLENLFSMLDMDWKTEEVRHKTERFTELTYLRECFFTLIIETLRNSITRSHHYWDNFQSIIKFLARPQNASFITFNYDLAIEQALESSTSNHGLPDFIAGYGISFDRLNTPREERLVLKLHGSANWIYCKACKNFTTQSKYILPNELERMRGSLHNESKCNSTNEFINVIVPPSWNKLNYTEEITKVWFRSIQEISRATHLFILGYSFPRTDIFFDQLVGLALRNSRNLQKVIVLNPDNKIDEILKEFFEPNFKSNRVEFLPLRFEEIERAKGTFDIREQKQMEVFLKMLHTKSK